MTHAGLVPWASRLGPSVTLVAQEIFADRAVDGMRPVRALIRLADKYTSKRLEAACRRAMHFATPSYRSNPHSRRTDRSSSGSHTSTATSTPTTPH